MNLNNLEANPGVTRLSRREFLGVSLLLGLVAAGGGVALVLPRVPGNPFAIPAEISPSQGDVPFGVLSADQFPQDSTLGKVIQAMEINGDRTENFISGLIVLEDGQISVSPDKGSYITLSIPLNTGESVQEVYVPLQLWNSKTHSFTLYTLEGGEYRVAQYGDPAELVAHITPGEQMIAGIPFSSPSTDLQWIGDSQVKEVSTGPSHTLIVLRH